MAAHNRSGVNYIDPKFTDSPPGEQGRAQARLVGKGLCQMGLITDGDCDMMIMMMDVMVMRL